MSKITAEQLDTLANILFSYPNRKLQMDDGCQCLAGTIGSWESSDKTHPIEYCDIGIFKICDIFGIKTESNSNIANDYMLNMVEESLLEVGIGHKITNTDYIMAGPF